MKLSDAVEKYLEGQDKETFKKKFDTGEEALSVLAMSLNNVLNKNDNIKTALSEQGITNLANCPECNSDIIVEYGNCPFCNTSLIDFDGEEEKVKEKVKKEKVKKEEVKEKVKKEKVKKEEVKEKVKKEEVKEEATEEEFVEVEESSLYTKDGDLPKEETEEEEDFPASEVVMKMKHKDLLATIEKFKLAVEPKGLKLKDLREAVDDAIEDALGEEPEDNEKVEEGEVDLDNTEFEEIDEFGLEDDLDDLGEDLDV